MMAGERREDEETETEDRREIQSKEKFYKIENCCIAMATGALKLA